MVDYARHKRASVIVRGLRAVSDFEYEFQMALMNRHVEPTLETVFMMPAEQYTYLSSRLIRDAKFIISSWPSAWRGAVLRRPAARGR